MDEVIQKFKFKTPTTISVIGGTGSGKTTTVFNILKYKKELFLNPPERIVWCYSVYQESFDQFKDSIEFIKGLTDFNQFDPRIHNLVVLDDLLHSLDEEVAKSFTIYSHHLNVTVVFLSQVLFIQNKHAREVALNSHYIILFKSKRDLRSIRVFGSQLFPGELERFMTVYLEHTKELFSFILIDLHPKTRSRVSIHSGIYPTDIEFVYRYE